MGISGGSISPYMMAMIDIAREYGFGIIDPMTTLYEAGDEQSPGNATGSGWKYYMQDEVHPNELGQQLYGKAVYSYIASALK
jgi:lysophospholipase L1-like esterase